MRCNDYFIYTYSFLFNLKTRVFWQSIKTFLDKFDNRIKKTKLYRSMEKSKQI